jgi:hypothetical protein
MFDHFHVPRGPLDPAHDLMVGVGTILKGAENAPNDELKHFVEKIKLKLAMVQILTFRASFGAIYTHQSEMLMHHSNKVV